MSGSPLQWKQKGKNTFGLLSLARKEIIDRREARNKL